METVTPLAPPCATRFDCDSRLKLSNAQVDEIRALLASGLTQRVIAARYGIHQVTVSEIALGKRRHVTPRSFAERFWARVDKSGSPHPVLGTPCWLWTGGLFRGGYGKVRGAGKTRKAHRVAYELVTGQAPPDLLACHRCDVPACVNPGHIFFGTVADNNADREAKGRTARGVRSGMYTHPESRSIGSANGRARLSEESARAIARPFAAGESQRALAVEFEVSKATIGNVTSGAYWRHAVDAADVTPKMPRGARTRGVDNPSAKLTPEKAAAIRVAYERGDGSFSVIGRAFGVSRSTVHHIVRGRTWVAA